MIARLILALGASAALAACANKTALEPAAGQALPPAPYGSEVRPDAEDLLRLPFGKAAPAKLIEEARARVSQG